MDQCEPVLKDIGKVLARDRRIRREDDAAAIAETKNWVEGKLETKIARKFEVLEQRLTQHIKQIDALGETIAAERAARPKEIITAVENTKRWVEDKLETKILPRRETLEQRRPSTQLIHCSQALTARSCWV